jgi:hypothetical protein
VAADPPEREALCARPRGAPSSNGRVERHTAALRPSPCAERLPVASRSPVRQRGEVLFEVPFASAMSDCDLALLARTLGLWTRTQPTTHSRPDGARRHDTPGFARLDYSSGLFLKRGVVEEEWLLEARTWGRPAAQSVHEWHVLAAGAARRLDPAVTFPERLESGARTIPDRPLGRAANKRLARFRRHLVGAP